MQRHKGINRQCGPAHKLGPCTCIWVLRRGFALYCVLERTMQCIMGFSLSARALPARALRNRDRYYSVRAHLLEPHNA
jgi:hypothetical protein